MNRSLTALFAALEAAIVVGVGIAIPLAPLTILWGAQFGFTGDWGSFWRASVDIWLVGHGADLSVTLDPAFASTLGISAADATFPVTIAALGFAGLTFALALRAGRRVAETRFRLFGEIVAVGTFLALALAVTVTAGNPLVHVSVVQGVLFPTVIFTVGVIIGSLRTRRAVDDDNGSSVQDWINDWRPMTRATFSAALRGGTTAVFLLLGAAAVIFAIALAASYARIIALYESLHTEVLGGIAVTIGQLALLPNLVVWTASWLIGPGFAIGTGSTVSPVSTQLGPVPAIPLLGALPQGSLAFGFVGLIVPIVAGFFAGVLVRGPVAREVGTITGARSIGIGIGIGIVGGVLLGIITWFSAGAAGPGRLVDVGPNPFAVGGWAALEIAIAASVGLLVSGRRARSSDR